MKTKILEVVDAVAEQLETRKAPKALVAALDLVAAKLSNKSK